MNCTTCQRRVWPWQRKGWITGKAVWHAPRCIPKENR